MKNKKACAGCPDCQEHQDLFRLWKSVKRVISVIAFIALMFVAVAPFFISMGLLSPTGILVSWFNQHPDIGRILAGVAFFIIELLILGVMHYYTKSK